MSNIRTCKCCGKTYKYCAHCGGAEKTPWKNLCDTEECRELFNIVSAYNMGKATKVEVERFLYKNNITDFDQYLPNISKTLNELFAKKKNKKNKTVDIDLEEKDEVVSEEVTSSDDGISIVE